MDLARFQALVGQLEKSPDGVQLYHGEFETMIATLMEDVHQLSLAGADNGRKMQAEVSEYQAR